MIERPTKPGQLCRVTGSRSQANGEGDGPNIGKKVTTMFLHQQQADDRIPVWHCSGEGLQTYYSVGSEADFLMTWLEVIKADPIPPVSTTTKQELSTT